MASFTSPFPLPALLNSMRSHEAIPKHSHTPAARLHFPDFPSLCFISRGSTVKARSQREQPGAKCLFHINQASMTLLNDCFFVQRLKGSRARPTQIIRRSTSSVQRFFDLLAAGMLPYQDSKIREICLPERATLPRQAYLTATSTFAQRPWPAAYQFFTPTLYSTPKLRPERWTRDKEI